MIIIGLTGSIGSGKTTVSDIFKKLGIAIIDMDVIAREVVKHGTPAFEIIKEHFGVQILTKDGELNRSMLRDIIFNNAMEKLWLENLLHPFINACAYQQALASTSPYCIVVIPLLFETGRADWLDRVLVVLADKNQQIKRVVMRDQCNTNDIKKILNVQVSDEIRRQGADDIIQNTGSTEDLHKQVLKLHKFYLELAA